MKYIVTGAAGFIGSHIAKALKLNGHDVCTVDSFNDYYAPTLKHQRVEALLSPVDVTPILGDLADTQFTRDLINQERPDTVIHLAAQAGVRISLRDSHKYVSNNLVAFSNILTSVVENDIPNFLYASSSSVYGNSSTSPYSENEKNLHPISFYGATKLANELITPTIIKSGKTKARGLRFFTVYGPWGRPDMAYFRLMSHALTNSTFELFGSGDSIRDFTYIDDVVAMTMGLDLELQGQQAGYADIVNIGGGNPVSINQMIAEISRQTGFGFHFKKSKPDINDVDLTCADPTYLQSLIHQKPETNIAQGLSKVLAWAKSEAVNKNLADWINSVQ
jgi:UDP-glucuronate 4-epimerase